MRAADFDFEVPPELVAQHPPAQRGTSRLLVLHRESGQLEHRSFRDLVEYFRPGDVLVLNDSKVIPARLRGVNARTGGRFELLLMEEMGRNDWWVMVKPGKRAQEGTVIELVNRDGVGTGIEALVVGKNAEGHRRVNFKGTPDISEVTGELGEVPLPPYIRREGTSSFEEDVERYQTVFAAPPGSVAAPTAGLHFTREILQRIEAMGVAVRYLTLHVGVGTFAPVKSEDLAQHTMHEERFELSAGTAESINQAKAKGGRVIAVGTTTMRVLESVAAGTVGILKETRGRTRIFIHPPFTFRIVDGLLTNFHLPRSTLLMLVSAFASPGRLEGREKIFAAYAEAVRERYRFYSYGDAMFLA
ncbi:MAG TPA: tRNA preQ1(34) S-adenosylmethionine ribosyltransferase-isomerase QueA [Verrucomicrobiae bacterium]|nr:tRNA preQ1(34) S-adenosylmethionine ribosyltransferase-isomerase QueA [Verrucomicrobiae bacterium]